MGDDTTKQHNLVGSTLIRVDDGIVARCTCGWVSRECFSSLIASSIFRDHQEAAKNDL